MTRRIYIVSKDTEITQEVIDAAIAATCSEIVKGIPPILSSNITEDMLPYAYEEPTPPPPPPSLCIRMAKLLAVNAGVRPAHVEVYMDLAPTGFEYDCYVSETVFNEYTAGHIVVGNFLLVEFVDDRADAGCVFAKVHKTW